MFGQGSFIIDQNTTPEMLRKKREQLMALMPQYGKARYVGEGVGQLAYGIGSGIKTRKMDKYEGERSKEATDQFSAAVAGGPMTILGMQGVMPVDAPQQPTGPSYPFGQDAIAPTGESDPASGLSMGMDAPVSTGNFVVDGLVQRGMPEHIAKGFAMNFQDESGLNPTAVGDNGNAYGLAQWNGPRKAALLNYAQSNGQNAADPNVQLDFLMAELGGPESAAWSKIAGAADANQAGAAVLNHFERPAEVHRARREASYLGGSGGGGAYAPQRGQYASGGQDMAALLQAAANPWLTPEQRGVVNNLIQQQQSQSAAADERYWRQNDPLYQAQLAEAQRAAQPQAPKPIEVGGVLLDPNTYQPIFDSRTPDPGYTMVSPVEADQMGLPPGAYQRGADGRISEIGGGGVNVTVGGGPELGKLSTDFGYVLDINGKPVIDPSTGLPKAAPVPGSPAAIEAETKKNAAGNKAGNATTATETVTNAAKRAREAAGKREWGGFGSSIIGWVNPYSDSAEVIRQVDVLKSNAKIGNLQAMRDASPTGGALGAVTAPELQMLADKSGALDPQSPNFLRDLDDYERTLLRTIHGPEIGDQIYQQTRGDNVPDADGWQTINGVKIRVKK